MNIPTIAIVGRRNVGKSALFNRLIEEKKAIVSPISGTTRDRTEGSCLWRGQKIRLIDTGGMDIGTEDVIEREVLAQVDFAIKNSDLILFIVDLRVGLLPQEIKIAKKIMPYKNKTILVGNKADGLKIRLEAENPEWKKLGLGAPSPVSATTGAGVGDLLDIVFERLVTPAKLVEPPPASLVSLEGASLRIAIIGRPNVGKSSLLNALLGEKRVIVSPIPFTTREPQDTEIVYEGKKIVLVDTAGLRKKTKIKEEIEKRGVQSTLRALKKAQIVLFVLEPFSPLLSQDKHIGSFIAESKASVIIIVNKWDLIEKGQQENWIRYLKKILPHLSFAPTLFVSALTGLNINKVMPLVLKIAQARQKFITQKEVQNILPKLIFHHRPVRAKGTGHPVIKKIEQTAANPPQFTVWIGKKQSLHEIYIKFLEKQIRGYFGFEGTPVRIWVRQEE